jgi:lysophospholipase L1-like esterase
VSFVSRLGEHPLVERQPAELAVDIQQRGIEAQRVSGNGLFERSGYEMLIEHGAPSSVRACNIGVKARQRTRVASPVMMAVIATGLIAAAGARAPAPSQRWVATWGTAQQAFRATAVSPAPVPAAGVGAPSAPVTTPAGRAGPQRRFGVPPSLPGLEDQTIRMIVRTSIGGRTVRVRLSQAFGAPAVTVGAAHIATRAADSAIVPSSDRVLTFGGKPSSTLYAGQVMVSDPVTLDAQPSSDLAVSLYLPGATGPPTSHTFGLRPTYVSKQGDVTAAVSLTDLASTAESYYWITGVDVLAPASAGTLVTFGDSITDGDQSTPDTIGMWPAVLAARLQRGISAPATAGGSSKTATAGIGVVNAGISGNRVLGDNNSGLARLTRDALSVPGIRWMTLLEGINDITAATRSGQAGSTFTADTLIVAYRQMIEAAHVHGVKIIGCTLTPYGGSNVHTEQGEAIRQAVNSWIRTGGAFDAVFDFDAATRDPQEPSRFRPEADSPDMLHPANGGYALMANSIDLSVFGRLARSPGQR